MFPSTRDDARSSSSSGWDDSDLLTSSRYDDTEKRPTREEADAVCAALAKHGFETLKFIARGSYGYVYKMGYRTRRDQPRPRVVAVKVMYAQTSKDLPGRVKVFHEAFDKAMRRRFAQHRRQHDDLDVDTGFFTEDLVYPRVVFPVEVDGQSKEYTLHFMELLTGEAMYDYLRTQGHRLQLKNVMTLLCRLLHALHFFHDAGLMFNDLKLENLMVDPVTLHVSCIDFYDSNTQCTHTHCTERPRPHIIFTFRDPFHEEGLHEDVWRLGLTMLDILESVHRSHLRHRGHLRDDEDDALQRLARRPRERRVQVQQPVPQRVNVRDVVRRVCQKAATVYAADRSYGPPARALFAQIRTSLTQMLHARVDARPSVARLLQSVPWRVCAHAKHPPKHQRPSYRPLQRLTPLQRSRKASLEDLHTAKLYVSEPASDAEDTGSSASTLGNDWRHDAVSSSAYRTTTTKRARRRPPTHRRPAATPTRKRRAQAELSASSATASSLAALPRTQEAMRKRRTRR